MNSQLLEQVRNGHRDIINISPEETTVIIPDQVSDGFGGTVADPTGAGSPTTIKYRVFHRRFGPEGDTASPPGLSTNLARAIMSDYDNDLSTVQGATITYEGKKYKVGIADPLKNYGGIYGWQADLTEEGDA